MLKGGKKTIINVSSTSTYSVGNSASKYSGSKYVLLRFIEFLIIEYREEGLLVYSVYLYSTVIELGLGILERMYFSEQFLLRIVLLILTI
jgi:short-subunit dehydrogenase